MKNGYVNLLEINNVQWLKLTSVQLDTSTLRKDMNYQIKITLALILIYPKGSANLQCKAKAGKPWPLGKAWQWKLCDLNSD